jgi:hypothetical protein
VIVLDLDPDSVPTAVLDGILNQIEHDLLCPNGVGEQRLLPTSTLVYIHLQIDFLVVGRVHHNLLNCGQHLWYRKVLKVLGWLLDKAFGAFYEVADFVESPLTTQFDSM